MTKIQQQVSNVLDVLRGSVPTEEQKYYVLTMMTLAVLETKKDLFQIPANAAWSELIKSEENIGERLQFACATIEEENVTLEHVLSTVSFVKVDDSVLYTLALHIDQLALRTNRGEFATILLAKCAENEGRKGGDYLTPQFLSQLMLQLLQVEDNTSIYDPTAGTGQFLNEATTYAEGLSLHGEERHTGTWAMSKMLSILQGNEEIDLRIGDVINDPQFTNGSKLQQFDYVLMDPPYGLSKWGYETAQKDVYNRFTYGVPPKSRGDMAFVLHALASINETGKAALIVPHGVLFRGATEATIRHKLIQEDVVEAVIGLPSGLLYASSIPVAMIILNKNKPQDRKNQILFIQAEEEFEQFRTDKVLTEDNIQTIVETYHSGREEDRFSKWVHLENIQGNSLSLQTYFEEDRIDSLLGKVQVDKEIYEQQLTAPLKQVSKLFRGINTPSAEKMKSADPTHLLIELSDVQDGEVLIDELTPVSIDPATKSDRYEVREGDIILSSRGTAIKLAVIPEIGDKRLLLSNHFIGIRSDRTIHPTFLKTFLESPIGMFYLTNSQKGTTVTVLTTKDIQDIPIPTVPYEQQGQIAKEIIQSNQAYKKRLREAEEQYQQEYEHVYKQMGLQAAYTKLN